MSLTVQIEEELLELLTDRAKRHGRTIEEEALRILRAALGVPTPGSVDRPGNLGSRIAARFSAAGGMEQDIPEMRGQSVVPPDLTR